MSKPFIMDLDEAGEPPFEQEQMFGRDYLKSLYPMDGSSFDEHAQARFWMNIFTNMALSTIKWNNLPDSIDPRALEYILLHFGCGAAFVDNGQLLFAQATYADQVNMYYNPNSVLLTAPSGQQWTRHAEPHVQVMDDGETQILDPDAAVAWDNILRAPLMPMLRNYAKRMAHYDAIMDTNIEAQLTPWIIAAPPEGKRNAKEWQHRLFKGKKFIPVNEGSTLPYTLDTKAPYVAGNIKDLQRTIMNEVLTLIGVDNANVDKRERVQTAEVISNNDQVMSMREARLKPRVQFAERCNAMFGTDISVEWGLEGVYADVAANNMGNGLGAVDTMEGDNNE